MPRKVPNPLAADAFLQEPSRSATRSTQGTTPSAQGAIKHDQEKLRTDLLPVRPLLDVSAVLTYGANKYAARNWEKGFDYSRPYGAALRHLYAWWGGEDLDPESGLPHLAHAMCCLMFLSEFSHSWAGEDDRPSAS